MSRVALTAGVLAVCCAAAPAHAQVAPPDQPAIVATGEALTTVAPDRAYIQIAADGRAQKAADAQRVAAEAMTSLQNALKAVVPPDAIKTTGYSLAPEYDYVSGKQQFRDYLARNQVEVRVDDLTKLSTIIDASGTSGATTVSGLRFDLKTRATVEQAALKDAVADAMARAGSIAAGAGRTLGPIIRITEQRITQNPRPNYVNYDSFTAGRAGGGVPTPIEPGQIEVHAQVTLTIAIK